MTMNRRKAISLAALAGLGAVMTGAVYKYWTLARKPDLGWLHQNPALLEALCETILPEGDTPGAKTAGVPAFVVRMISDCTPRNEQNSFISGLQEIQQYCRQAFHKPFEHCDPPMQTAALEAFEAKGRPYPGLAGKISTRLAGRSFFTILKETTVDGYCTSQAGATKGLAYVYIPGSYSGCTLMQPGQKAWATG
jgi:hypothetical protein